MNILKKYAELTLGFSEIMNAVCELNNQEESLFKELVLSYDTSSLGCLMINSIKDARSDVYRGNIRTDTASWGDKSLCEYILYTYSSNPKVFQHLVQMCAQRLNSNDKTKKFSPDNYFLYYSENDNCYYTKLIENITTPIKENRVEQNLLDFAECYKKCLLTQNFDKALAMLILFSFLNYNVVYLNSQFSTLEYSPTPTTELKLDTPYIIKPVLNKHSHLSILESYETVNHTVDRSCVDRSILVNKLDSNLSVEDSVFYLKKSKGGNYYILHKDKYLQWLGLTSNTRIIADDDLNARCSWKINLEEESEAFYIVPQTTNPIITLWAALDIPNGASSAENLPLWIFLNNSTRSQLFRFHEVMI